MNIFIKNVLTELADGAFHSEQKIARKLRITENTLKQIIEQIQQLGIDLITEKNQNLEYKIKHPIEFLNKNTIVKYLDAKYLTLGEQIEVLETVDSTNNYLMRKINPSSTEIQICLAEHQTLGRGRLGRKWFSPYGRNIYLSLKKQFFIEIGAINGLGLAIAISVIKTLAECGIIENLSIKWPNDILWHNRKLAGILVENSGELNGLCQTTIIGIGLNTGMVENNDINQPWCDISQIPNLVFSRNQLAGTILSGLIKTLEIFQLHGMKAFVKNWQKFDPTYKKKIILITPSGKKITGVNFGIDVEGNLLVQKNGKILRFSCGEISLPLPATYDAIAN